MSAATLSEGGIVYVLTNEAMPSMIKIGRTSGEGVERRVAELSRASGVPLPFQVAVARVVHDAAVVERALHVAFAPDRVNPAREFFAIDAYRAVALINAFPGRDLTPQAEQAAEREIERAEPGAVQAARLYNRGHRPDLSFSDIGVPIGGVIRQTRTGDEARVFEPRRVEFRGEVMSLTRAQRLATGVEHSVRAAPYWSYEGRSLAELYDEAHPLDTRAEMSSFAPSIIARQE